MEIKSEATLTKLNKELCASKHNLVKTYLKKNCMKDQLPLKKFMKSVEKDVIIYALKLAHGNQRVASFLLGINPTTLNEKLKSLQIHEFRRKRKLTLTEILDEIDFSSIS